MNNYSYGMGERPSQEYVRIDSGILDELIENTRWINETARTIQQNLTSQNFDVIGQQAKQIALDVPRIQVGIDDIFNTLQTIITAEYKVRESMLTIDQKLEDMKNLVATHDSFRTWWERQVDEFRDLIIAQAVFKNGEL